MQLCQTQSECRDLEQRHGDERCKDRTGNPGGDDFQKRLTVGHRATEQIPPDNGTDDCLAGGDRQSPLGHHVNRAGSRQRRHERARERIDRTERAEGVRRAGAAHHGAKNHEDAANQSRRGEAHHACPDSGAEDVGSVVSAQRPAEQQTARQEKKYRQVHSMTGSIRAGIRRFWPTWWGSNTSFDSVNLQRIGDILR